MPTPTLRPTSSSFTPNRELPTKFWSAPAAGRTARPPAPPPPPPRPPPPDPSTARVGPPVPPPLAEPHSSCNHPDHLLWDYSGGDPGSRRAGRDLRQSCHPFSRARHGCHARPHCCCTQQSVCGGRD